jgi:hypothetical protein
MTAILRHLVPIGILILVVWGIWFLVTNFDVIEMTQLDPEAVQAQTDQLESEMIANVTGLQSVDLSTGLFELNEYALLLDKQVMVQDVPVQNRDPFAPLP